MVCRQGSVRDSSVQWRPCGERTEDDREPWPGWSVGIPGTLGAGEGEPWSRAHSPVLRPPCSSATQ